MKLNWNGVATIFLAVLLALIVLDRYRQLTRKKEVNILLVAETTQEPRTIEEYLALHYPNS